MIWARFISIEALQRVAYCVLRVAWTLPNERRNTKHVVFLKHLKRAHIILRFKRAEKRSEKHLLKM